MNRILFLDVDGVLNSSDFLRAIPKPEPGTIFVPSKLGIRHFDPADMIDPVRVERLNRIVRGLDVDVVVSSSWRHAYELEQLEEFLKSRGYEGSLYDVTPKLSGHERHVEIKRWLSQLSGEPRFVVIDDDQDAGVGFGHRYVQTVNGLEEEHVERARRILE
jgi:hypothetical protein